MSKTYLSSIKKGAVINVPVTTEDIARLHSILLRHLDSQCSLDDKSFETIERLCHKIDVCASEQNQTELKEVNF